MRSKPSAALGLCVRGASKPHFFKRLPSPDHADLAAEPWHMTLALNDFRPYNLDDVLNVDSQQLKFLLSLPESQSKVQGLSVCYYVLPSINVTSTGQQGEDSCGVDVVSDACLGALSSSLSRGACVLSEGEQLEAQRECGFMSTNWDAADFSYRSCRAEDVPYVSVPSGYITSVESPDVILPDHHESARDFSSYDLRVRQMIPVILVTSWNETASATAGAALGMAQTRVSRAEQRDRGESEARVGSLGGFSVSFCVCVRDQRGEATSDVGAGKRLACSGHGS